MTEPGPDLAELLERHRSALARFIQLRAGGLMRHESGEDLIQGIHLRALKQVAGFTYRSDNEFFAWLVIIARQHFGDRNDHWNALRRHATVMLRITTSEKPEASSPGVQPVGQQTGPLTFAERREQIQIATKVLSTLGERDQQIIGFLSAGQSIQEVADLLDIEYDAAEIARRRALDRFRKNYAKIVGNQTD